MKYLLDTNICIYLIKHKPITVLERFRQCDISDIGISVITLAELQYGVENSQQQEKNQTALDAFVLPLEVLPVEQIVTPVYGHIRAVLRRQGTPVGALDLLIAAQAIAHNLTLVSHNLKEFNRIDGLRVESWL